MRALNGAEKNETDEAFEFEHSEGMAEHQSDLPNQTEDYGKK